MIWIKKEPKLYRSVFSQLKSISQRYSTTCCLEPLPIWVW